LLSAFFGVGLACAGAIATAGPAIGAGAAPSTAPPSNARSSVTLMLTPANRAALYKLASTPDVPRNTRAARLATVRPTRSARTTVAEQLRHLGLTVGHQTTWSVTASGPAQRVNAVFGTGTRHAPKSMAKYVTAVVSTETKKARHPLGLTTAVPSTVIGPPYNGTALRSLYQQSSDGSPGGGTIATLQFAGYDNSDLQTYANDASIPFDASGTSAAYQEVVVDGADKRDTTDPNGSTEVALDQETLLSVAPHSAQRVYFTPNTDAGSVDALHQVAADASDATHSYYHLVAMSTSWGVCERYDPVLQSEEDAIAEIVAAGVTVFAATGDGGGYDCRPGGFGSVPPPSPAVDFPGSSPFVVAVGGTTRWPLSNDSGWGGVYGNVYEGSGGGVSQVFPRPGYQANVGTSYGNHRLVPDIAAVADPTTGFKVYSGGSYSTVGGTSLAAPATTGMFVNSLQYPGLRGRGDIHLYLYDAPAGAIKDVTIETVHQSALYPAKPGYDLSTGLGVPVWDTLGPFVGRQPRFTAPGTGPWGTPPASGHAPPTW
jgi:kumamolisin